MFTEGFLTAADASRLNEMERQLANLREKSIPYVDERPDYEEFFAKITSGDGSGNYAWTEQFFNSTTGAPIDMPGGRTGTTTTMKAVERNGILYTTFPFYVLLRERIVVGTSGAFIYDFEHSTAATLHMAKMVDDPFNQAYANATYTPVKFNTVVTDTDGYTDANKTKMTIPVGLGGWYVLVMELDWQSSLSTLNAETVFGLGHAIDGGTGDRHFFTTVTTVTSAPYTIQGACICLTRILQLNQSQTVNAELFQGTGNNLTNKIALNSLAIYKIG